MSGIGIHGWAGDHLRMTSHNGGRLNTSREVNFRYGSATKFLFVRNPYTRLFSAYSDKIFTGAAFRINSLLDYKSGKRDQNHQPWTLLAMLNISFAETIKYGLGDYTGAIMDDLKPLHRFCDPCHVRYDFIGKLETLGQDVEHILTSLNQTQVMTSLGNDVTRTNERGMLVDTIWQTFWIINHNQYDYWTKDVCEVKDAILRRVWKHFQIRGLVRDSSRYPILDRNCSVDEKEFQSMALDAWRESGPGPERESQKSEYFRQAYRSVPLSLLKRLRSSISRDCQLFDYDCSPSDIFGGRLDGDEENNLFSDVKFMYD